MVELIRAVGDDEWQHMTIGTTTTSTIHTPPVSAIVKSMGDFPIVYDMSGKDGAAGDAMLTPDQAAGIINWFHFLKTKTNIPVSYFLLQNLPEEMRIKTAENWDLIVKTTEPATAQFTALQTWLKTHPKHLGLQYIDLRYPGRVYWQ
jgi:hypothetical protein